MVCWGRALGTVGNPVDLLFDVDGQTLDDLVHVDPGAVKDPPAHGIMGDGEKNVLGGEVSVAPILGPLRGDHKDPFESGGKHGGPMLQQGRLQTQRWTPGFLMTPLSSPRSECPRAETARNNHGDP